MHVCARACAYARACVSRVHVRICVIVRARVRVHVRVYLRVRGGVRVDVYVRVSVHMCGYVWVGYLLACACVGIHASVCSQAWVQVPMIICIGVAVHM